MSLRTEFYCGACFALTLVAENVPLVMLRDEIEAHAADYRNSRKSHICQIYAVARMVRCFPP